MSQIDPRIVIRAWRDPKFAASLSDDVRLLLPPSPAGTMRGAAAGLAENIGPQGTFTADCMTATADCQTSTAGCATFTGGCITAAAACQTATISCQTFTSDCDTRTTCTRSSGCS